MVDSNDYQVGIEGALHEPSFPRVVMAYVLLAFGIGVAIWVLFSLIGLLGAQTTPALVNRVTPGGGGPVVFSFPEGDFTIPADVFVPIGYLIVCFIYAIAVGLAMTLINSGASLLQPDFNKTLQRLLKKLERK